MSSKSRNILSLLAVFVILGGISLWINGAFTPAPKLTRQVVLGYGTFEIAGTRSYWYGQLQITIPEEVTQQAMAIATVAKQNAKDASDCPVVDATEAVLDGQITSLKQSLAGQQVKSPLSFYFLDFPRRNPKGEEIKEGDFFPSDSKASPMLFEVTGRKGKTIILTRVQP